jgi:hypothetical protein
MSESTTNQNPAHVEHVESISHLPHNSLESVAEGEVFANEIATLREGGKDPVLNATIRELIYHSFDFIVYLDENLRLQYRGVWAFPAASEDIRFEVSRLESLTLGNQSFFGMKPDEDQLLAMRRMLAEVITSMHGAADLVRAQAYLTTASQTITGIVTDNTRLKRLVASFIVTTLTGLIGWLWMINHKGTPGINPANEFGLWIPLGAIGALLFSFTRMHTIEVKAFSSNWLVFWESAARILTGAIGALLLVAAAKANLLLGVLSQSTTTSSAFWGLLTLSILAGASERLVPDFITRMEGSGTTPAEATPPAQSKT